MAKLREGGRDLSSGLSAYLDSSGDEWRRDVLALLFLLVVELIRKTSAPASSCWFAFYGQRGSSMSATYPPVENGRGCTQEVSVILHSSTAEMQERCAEVRQHVEREDKNKTVTGTH